MQSLCKEYIENQIKKHRDTKRVVRKFNLKKDAFGCYIFVSKNEVVDIIDRLIILN